MIACNEALCSTLFATPVEALLLYNSWHLLQQAGCRHSRLTGQSPLLRLHLPPHLLWMLHLRLLGRPPFLWAAVAAFDDALQRDFLMFVTGSKTAPMGGLGALRPPAHASFKVQRAGPDSDALPTSHTCFNTLLLPEYDPPQKVAKLLEYAVREGHEGFALE